MNDGKRVNVEQLIDENRLSRFQVMVVVMCGIVAILDGFDTFSISFVAPAIAAEWGLDSSAFGPIFSAALVGILIGALTLGATADRIGRKSVIILSVLSFGTFAFLTGFAESTTELIIYRFLTGLGIGGAIPNIIALTTEYSPKRLKTVMVVVMFSGFPLGGLLGGLLSTQLIAAWGWPSVFFFGGVVPLVFAVMMYFWMPESIPWLVHRKSDDSGRRIAAYLSRIAPGSNVSETDVFELPLADQKLEGRPIRHLFTDNRTTGTLMLWVIFYTNLLMYYFLGQWLPTVFADAGLPLNLAILTGVLLNAGSMSGGVCVGHFVDKYGPYRILAMNYIAAAAFTAMIGFSGQNVYLVGAMVFFAGFCVGGGQLVANALSANYYPAGVRATGVAWAVGWSRIGAICGPLFAGVLIARSLDNRTLFMVCALPALVAATAVWYMGRQVGDRQAPADPGPARQATSS